MIIQTAKIADVDVKRDGTTYVKLSIDGRVISSGINQKRIIDKESISPKSVRVKVIKAHQDSVSALKTTESYSALIGSKYNRIISSKEYGNFFIGPATFTAHPENIRIGGLFRLNGLMLSTMPSTIITPIPTVVFDNPMQSNLETYRRIFDEYTQFLSRFQ